MKSGVSSKAVTRPYRKKRRADSQAETRQRIIDAAIALHQSIGPAATTISDVAERAGVGRVTVYRHFPDEMTLSRACSGHYFTTYPFPDPNAWAAIPDARERLRTGLRVVYAYHRTTEAMISHVLADARGHPVMAPYHAHWRRVVEVLAEPFTARGRQAKLVRAAVALALSFDAWRLLVREQRLPEDEAVGLMVRLVGDCTRTR